MIGGGGGDRRGIEGVIGEGEIGRGRIERAVGGGLEVGFGEVLEGEGWEGGWLRGYYSLSRQHFTLNLFATDSFKIYPD